jgi:hypothetical protein
MMVSCCRDILFVCLYIMFWQFVKSSHQICHENFCAYCRLCHIHVALHNFVFVLLNCFAKYIFCYSMWCDLNWIQICVKRKKKIQFSNVMIWKDKYKRVLVWNHDLELLSSKWTKLWNLKLFPLNQF